MIPRLHVVTDDDVLADPRFLSTAAGLGAALGRDVALHVRGHQTPGRRVHELVGDLAAELMGTSARLLVADRVDVALATDSVGVRVGAHSIPVAAARALLGDRILACSVHGVEEAEGAVGDGVDFLVLGTIWPTASHPGRPGAGTGLVRAVAERVDAPVVAIGGVTPDRVPDAVTAGAAGVAVLRGVWGATDPIAAARVYIRALDQAGSMAREGARQ